MRSLLVSIGIFAATGIAAILLIVVIVVIALRRRKARPPQLPSYRQYITFKGRAVTELDESLSFGGLEITFNQNILRPRPWTLEQSLWAAELLAVVPPGPVLELCCGAGHIGLAAVQNTERQAILVDMDPVACAFASTNAENAGLAERVVVRCARIDNALSSAEYYPLIIADPPWVPSSATARFPEDPLLAIDGGVDGTDIARTCFAIIRDHLLPSGAAVVQLGTETQLTVLHNEFADSLELVQTRTFGDRGVLAQLNRL